MNSSMRDRDEFGGFSDLADWTPMGVFFTFSNAAFESMTVLSETYVNAVTETTQMFVSSFENYALAAPKPFDDPHSEEASQQTARNQAESAPNDPWEWINHLPEPFEAASSLGASTVGIWSKWFVESLDELLRMNDEFFAWTNQNAGGPDNAGRETMLSNRSDDIDRKLQEFQAYLRQLLELRQSAKLSQEMVAETVRDGESPKDLTAQIERGLKRIDELLNRPQGSRRGTRGQSSS